MALKAIFFDVDGTLADTERGGHLPAYNDAFREMGLEWHWSSELYRDELLLLPGGRERIRHYVLSHHPPLGSHQHHADSDLTAWVNQVHAVKSRWFRRRVESGQLCLRPGVRRLIGEASRAGIRIGLVTNASQRSLEPFLHHTLGTDLLPAIDLIVGGEEVARKKPAPDLYLRALEAFALPAGDCVAIEDSAMGLCAASAAGLRTLVTTNADTVSQDFSVASAVVDGLGEPETPWHVLKGALNGFSWATPQALDELPSR